MYQLGSDWLLTPARVAVHLPTKTVVLADLHLGYSDARRQAGDAIPDVPFDEQLQPLKQVCATLDVTGLVVAGDLCEARLDRTLIDRFAAFVESCRLEWRGLIPGNHDRGWADVRGLVPMYPDGLELGGWTIIHGDRTPPPGPTVMGHVHPAWRQGGVVQPCYLAGRMRLILPAFSLDAAGGAVNGSPRWIGMRALSIAEGRVVDRGLLKGIRNPRRAWLRGLRRRPK